MVVATGQTKGKTMLALPPLDMSGPQGGGQNKERADKDRVHVLESAVVMWSERINIALSRNPESAFANGNQPTPLACHEFWNSKMVDLGEILEQLNGPQILKVGGRWPQCREGSMDPSLAAAESY